MSKNYERMMTDINYALGQMPAGSINPKHEYAVVQRLKDLWKKSRRRAKIEKVKVRK